MTAAQIAGPHLSTYENLYLEADPTRKGYVAAQDAARFLKKSNLGNALLGKIWDMADSQKVGFLDKDGFFVALKLIAASQNHVEVSRNALAMDLPPPRFVPVPDSPSTPMFASAFSDVDWVVQTAEKAKYDAIFDSLGPENGKLSGDKVKPVLLNSGLATHQLGKIWELSDIDKDGFLDRDEMAVALHLVYRALENEPVPPALPREMVPPAKRGRPAGGAPGAFGTDPTGSRRGSQQGMDFGTTGVGANRRMSEQVTGVRGPFHHGSSTGGPRSRAASVTSLDSLGNTIMGTVTSAGGPIGSSTVSGAGGLPTPGGLAVGGHSPGMGRGGTRSLTSTEHMLRPHPTRFRALI